MDDAKARLGRAMVGIRVLGCGNGVGLLSSASDSRDVLSRFHNETCERVGSALVRA